MGSFGRKMITTQKRAVRRNSVVGILCLAALFQGFMLIWMQCCCGDSGFKSCSCSSESAPLSNPELPRISDLSDCGCTLNLISGSQQPIPIPNSFMLEKATPGHSPVALCPPCLTLARDPILPESSASPETSASRSHPQAFLCVFRC